MVTTAPGKRGPKPKPTHLRLLEGNPGRRPMPDSEPVPAATLSKPGDVSVYDDASAYWDEVVAAMPPGLYTAADAPTLVVYAQSRALMQRAYDEVVTCGLTVTTEKGEQTSAALKAWALAADRVLKVGDRLGLSPGVRSRLSVPTRADISRPESKFAGLIPPANDSDY